MATENAAGQGLRQRSSERVSGAASPARRRPTFAAFRRDEGVPTGDVGLAVSEAIAVAAGAAAPAVARGAAAVLVVALAPSEPDAPEVPAADSHSATLEKTGRPAEAARARVAGSVATIDSRRLLTIASRDRRRKFIRDVAIREP